jgi:small-conductance mechanosensitive channel
MGQGVLAEIPNLIFVLLILLITRAISKLMQLFFVAVEEKRISMPGLHAETIPVTRRLAVAGLWIFALVVAYPYLPGSDSLAFKGVSVFLGLFLSFGSGGVISQAASGIVLVYSRAFKPGDYIRVAETEGTVLEVGILSTKVRTNKLEVVNLPNSVLLGSTCKNFSTLAQDKGLIVYTSVTIGYDTPWRQVHAMLLLAADRTEALRKEPQPFVVQIALSDFYVEYQLNANLDEPQRRLAVLAELHAHIQDVFNEYGVQIMSPHYENDPGGAAKMVPKEQWYAAPAEAPPKTD